MGEQLLRLRIRLWALQLSPSCAELAALQPTRLLLPTASTTGSVPLPLSTSGCLGAPSTSFGVLAFLRQGYQRARRGAHGRCYQPQRSSGQRHGFRASVPNFTLEMELRPLLVDESRFLAAMEQE